MGRCSHRVAVRSKKCPNLFETPCIPICTYAQYTPDSKFHPRAATRANSQIEQCLKRKSVQCEVHTYTVGRSSTVLGAQVLF